MRFLGTTALVGTLAFVTASVGCSFAAPAPPESRAVTMVMRAYGGNAAYATIYLVGPGGEYVSTLYVAGERTRYQADLARWNRLMQRSGRGIDGATGASIGSGRTLSTDLTIPDRMLNAGYTLRVETAVEDQNYYQNDVSLPLDDAHIGHAVAGTGFVNTLTIRR